MTEIYTVTALKNGNRSGHSYVVGAFTTEDLAVYCAESHTDFRGGIYACVVERVIIDRYNEEYMPEEVYRSLSNSCLRKNNT